MLKKLFPAVLILLSACTNNTPDKTANNTSIDPSLPEEEKKMKALIAEHPDSIQLKVNLINYYTENANYDNAIGEIEKILKKDSMNDRLWDMAGQVYYKNDDTAKAIHAFEKALEIKAEPVYILTLGSLYAQTADSMALVMADALLQAPKAQADKQALFIKGLYYNYAGDKKTALAYFDKCLELDYGYMFAYREKAICLYDLQKYNEAVDILQTAITIQPSFEEAYYWLGKCFEKLNKRKEAIESYQTAISLSSDFTEAKEALSKMGVTN